MVSEYYRLMFHELLEGTPEKQRFIVFQPVDRSGWGNRLRGLTLCILFALATKRILVIRDFLLEEHFLAPEGCPWRYGEWAEVLGALENETQTMQLHLTPTNWNEEEWQGYSRDSMDVLFPSRVVRLEESIGFFDPLMVNPHYTQLWLSLGLDVGSKIAWLGSLSKAFLNRPSSRLARAYRKLVSNLNFQENQPRGVIQFRTFYDIGSPQKSLAEDFLRGVRQTLIDAKLTGATLYIATDDSVVTQALSQGLSNLGSVVASQTKVVHTGSLHNGWEIWAEKVLTKLFRRSYSFFDFWAWLPEGIRPRPHTAVLAEWMVYGTCSFAISSFTSFMVYAMARTGNKSELYRFDPQTRTIGPLTNDQYFF